MQWPWRRMIVGALLGIIALWLAVRGVSWEAVGMAFRRVNLAPVLLALLVILATLGTKALRWRFLYFPGPVPSFRTAFQAMMAGQLVNLISPLRVGELARLIGVDAEIPGMKARSLGTIVVEKSLDTLILVLTGLLILPFIAAPNELSSNVLSLAMLTGFGVAVLYLIAFRSSWIAAQIRKATSVLPEAIAPRLERIMVSGLEGLSALRSARQSGVIVGISAFIGILGILPAYLLFAAFDLELDFATAALVHVVLTLGLLPPSTPAKLFVFEAVTQGILNWLGVDESIGLSYAIVFHIVVILPQIIFGIGAVISFDWSLGLLLSGKRPG